MTRKEFYKCLELYASWQEASELQKKEFIAIMDRARYSSETATRQAWTFFHLGWISRSECET